MGRDKLPLLLSIRRRETDQAMRLLAVCITVEQQAAERVAALDAAAAAEHSAVDRFAAEAPDGLARQQAFVRWAAWTRLQRREAAAAQAQAEDRSAQARAAVAAARAAARAVEDLIALRIEAARVLAGKKETHALDDLAGRRHWDVKTRDLLLDRITQGGRPPD